MNEPMTPEQLRDLDLWIALNVFKFRAVSATSPDIGEPLTYVPEFHSVKTGSIPHYTHDKAAAMDVLECAVNRATCTVEIIGSEKFGYDLISTSDSGIKSSAPTLPLAIAIFAKALFTTQP